MKSKEQLLTELNCIQRRLKQIENELHSKRDGLGASHLESARAHITSTKYYIENRLTT